MMVVINHNFNVNLFVFNVNSANVNNVKMDISILIINVMKFLVMV